MVKQVVEIMALALEGIMTAQMQLIRPVDQVTSHLTQVTSYLTQVTSHLTQHLAVDHHS